MYAGANPVAGFDPEGLTDCSYYDKLCIQTGCNYVCNTAPLICKYASYIPVFYGVSENELDCIRGKLQVEDAYWRQFSVYCIGGTKCLKDSVIDAYHKYVFKECGVSTYRYLGVWPFGNE